MSITQISILTLLMVLTGAVGAITGGNSLINVPIMIMVGMTPRQAVATNMFAVTFMTISATARFARAGILKWKLLVPLGVITAITSALGALIAVKLPETVVKLVVGISMGALVVFIAVYRKAEPPAPSSARRVTGYIVSTLLGIYGGFFSGGYTTLMTVLCTVCFSLTMMESVAVTKPVNLISCVAASVVFFMGGIIDLRVGIPLAAANLLGGWVGAHAALKGGDKFVRLLFLLTVGALAVKLVVWDVILRR
ncbi:MAG TPA: sulfite exporter TauE/SafE family protein [Polyangia bacterium]|nr:sulfite exporter TauE/SafE family protein [Polyangia bacterium]